MKTSSKRVVVGLSGGVDSSVAAYMLKKQGYEVIGLFMKNWHDDSVTISDECPWLEDSNDALLVAQKLNIPFQTVDLSEAYKTRIIDYMFREYEQGRTPNPDVLCNREIKFDVFLKLALDLGADFVATGHYCQKGWDDKAQMFQLLAGADQSKDQSYFLCQLSQQQLAKTLFPIGHLQKTEVRQMALELELVTADKKDSQGLCFVGKVRLPDFLQQKLAPKQGEIIRIEADFSVYSSNKIEGSLAQKLEQASKKITYKVQDGTPVGTHQGAHFFTIGQRKGLAVGGTVEPLFVLATDVKTNTVFVGEGAHHPGLFRHALQINNTELHAVRPDKLPAPGSSIPVQVRIRYRQPLQNAVLHVFEEVTFLHFENAQSAITSGQFAAWYQQNELLGSGVIA